MTAIMNNATIGHYTKNTLNIKVSKGNLQAPGNGKEYIVFGQGAALVDEAPQSVKDFFTNCMSQNRVAAKNRYPLISYTKALERSDERNVDMSTREKYINYRNQQ